MVTWLLESGERITTVVKGAMRPKSRFLGQYDLFYTCELLYYNRPGGDACIARECRPLKTRTSLRSDWRNTCCASYLVYLVLQTSQERQRQAGLFNLLDGCLDRLSEGPAGKQLVFWAELQLLRMVGLEPRLFSCPVCGEPLPSAGNLTFRPASGGFVCRKCSGTAAADYRPAPAALPAMLRAWRSAPGPAAAERTACSPRQTAALQEMLGKFLEYHLDIRLHSRYIVMKLL